MENKEPYNLPLDIKKEWGRWLSVARRLQAEARKQEGYVIAKCLLFLNGDGVPINWSVSTTAKIEPKSNKDISMFCDTNVLDVLQDIM